MRSLGTNYHMHTIFCDGKNTPEECVLAALERNMHSIGFSAHVPVPFFSKYNMPDARLEPYLAEISRLKNKYADQIEIYVGFEMDYVGLAAEELRSKYIDRVDYTIGSVHYICYNDSYHSIEGSKESVTDAFQLVGDPKKCVEIYYNDLSKIVRNFRPDIIGHLDVIKKRNTNNCYFDQNSDWYRVLVRKLLDEIKASGVIVELNTGGVIRGFLEEFYPAD